jgi:hypothetical protein
MLLDKANNAINNNNGYVNKLNDQSDTLLYCSERKKESIIK